MRILVFSDSHGRTDRCAAVVRAIVGIDMILHAGDHASDAKALAREFPEIPVVFVAGNCDVTDAPTETVYETDGGKILMTHGHKYSVKTDFGYSALIRRAKELSCTCAVFGHTHNPLCDPSSGVTLLNPGSIRYGSTYGVIEIEVGILKAAVCDASRL